MTKLATVFGTFALVALFGAFASTQTTDSEGAELGEPDTTFIAEAIVSSLGEIHVSEAALAKLSEGSVKELASRIIQDHSILVDRLLTLAEEHKISAEGTKGTPPLKVSEEAMRKSEELTGSTGEEVDANYLAFVVEKHESDLQLYKDQADNGTDEELKELASGTLPTLEEHLRQAESLNEQ